MHRDRPQTPTISISSKGSKMFNNAAWGTASWRMEYAGYLHAVMLIALVLETTQPWEPSSSHYTSIELSNQRPPSDSRASRSKIHCQPIPLPQSPSLLIILLTGGHRTLGIIMSSRRNRIDAHLLLLITTPTDLVISILIGGH